MCRNCGRRNCRATRYSRRKRRRSSAVAPFLRLRLLRFCACSVVAALASIRRPRLMKGFTLCCRRPGVCGQSVLALEIAPLLPLLCALAPCSCSCVVPPLKGGQRTSEAKLVFALETAPLLPLLCALALCSCAVPPLKRVQRTFVLETAPLLPLLCALALCSCVVPPLKGDQRTLAAKSVFWIGTF